jgi:twinkle protein
MKQKIEYLVVGLGCKIIVIDPLQDIFDALPEDEQAKFMKWEKDLVKREQVTIINISHSRKALGGQKTGSKGADLSEEDMMGHSSIYKSGGINIIAMRNKEAEDEIERNTTILKVTKARGIGFTGFVGDYYYDNETHQIWDKQDWLDTQEMEF